MSADPLSRVFSALADPTRRDMVARLTLADATVTELAEPYDVSLQAVSKHLRVLEDAGLVTRGRDAQRRPVHLEAEVLDLMTAWIERYRRQAQERYTRLDAVLAAMPDEDSPARRAASPARPRTTTNRRTAMSTPARPATRPRIEVDDRVPLVRIVREFDAPVSKVFRAHTDPDLYARWIGPKDLTTEVERFEPVTGGGWRFVQRRGDDEFWFHGCFHDVRQDELIVQTFTWEGMPDEVALEKLRLIDLGDGRTRLESTSLVDSFESRDAFVASGMEHGVVEGYEKLDARPRRLTALAAARRTLRQTQRRARRTVTGIEGEFEAVVRRWSGEAAWYFATLPVDLADEIRAQVEPVGFGSVRVIATIGGTTWWTSVFPDKQSGSYVLPVKSAVRKAERIVDDDPVTIHVAVLG